MKVTRVDILSQLEVESGFLYIDEALSDTTRVFLNGIQTPVFGITINEESNTTVIGFGYSGIEGWVLGDAITLRDNDVEILSETDYGNGYMLDSEGNKVYV